MMKEYGKEWGNNVVYGAIFHIDDYFFHAGQLDAYQSCSLSSLGRNHTLDLHHRITVDVTPIRFANLDEFQRLMYRELETIKCYAYVGNKKHPQIKNRLKARESSVYRIVSGVDSIPFVESFEEEFYESEQALLRWVRTSREGH